MPSMTCPHCETLTNFAEVWHDSHPPSGNRAVYVSAMLCQNERCKRIIGAIRASSDVTAIYETWPEFVSGKQFPDVQASIADAANEAHRCFSIHAFRAAMGMARAVVEATAKEKGIMGGNLEKKIEDLCAAGAIRQDTKEAAHAVRLVGNDAAHGDLASMVVDEADARDVLDLMDDILDEVFQSPAKVARVKANRAARKAASGSSP